MSRDGGRAAAPQAVSPGTASLRAASLLGASQPPALRRAAQVVRLRQMREERARLAMLQAAARAGAARAQLHEARSSLAAAEAALHARIAHVERQADAGPRPGAWFVQSHGHLDALRAALRVRRESVQALHAQAAQAAAVLATHRRLLAVSSARREQAESLLTRLQRRHRAAIVARHDAAQTELLPSSTRHRRFPLSPVPFRS